MYSMGTVEMPADQELLLAAVFGPILGRTVYLWQRITSNQMSAFEANLLSALPSFRFTFFVNFEVPFIF